MNMTRPREHDRDKIAQDLVKWAQKDDSINLNHFCALNLLAPSKISQWAKEDESFRQAYETAKAFLGYRREMLLNKEMLHVKAYDLNATTYDHFLKEERRDQSSFESNLKKEEIKSGENSLSNAMQQVMDGKLKQPD